MKEIIKLRAFLRPGIVQLPRFFATCSASGSGQGFSRLTPPGTQSNGKRSFIRPTQPPTEHKKVEQKQAPPAPARAKQSRLAGKLKASIKNLKCGIAEFPASCVADDFKWAVFSRGGDVYRADIDWPGMKLTNERKVTSIGQFSDQYFPSNLFIGTEKTLIVRNLNKLVNVNLETGAVKPMDMSLEQITRRKSPDRIPTCGEHGCRESANRNGVLRRSLISSAKRVDSSWLRPVARSSSLRRSPASSKGDGPTCPERNGRKQGRK